MRKKKIIIEIQNGMVQQVYSNDKDIYVEILNMDADDVEEEELECYQFKVQTDESLSVIY